MFRSEWGGGENRWRQAQEQGPAACGVLGDGGCGEKRLPSPKKGFSRDGSLERVRAEPAVLPAGWLRGTGGCGGDEKLALGARAGGSPRNARAMRRTL